LRELIKIIAAYISVTNGYSNEDEERVEYGIRIFTFEILKIIIVISIFAFFHKTLEAAVAILTMSLIKPFIGGYHENTQVKCFIATLIIIGCIVYLSLNVPMHNIAKVILYVVCLYAMWQQAPIINKDMKLTKASLIKRNRKIGISISIVFILLSFLAYRLQIISNIICWTILFQVIFMFNKRE
jgi:accessory gene regulator B